MAFSVGGLLLGLINEIRINLPLSHCRRHGIWL